MPKVVVCIASRTENPNQECFEYVQRAIEYAVSLGIKAGYGKAHSAHAVDHARNRGVAGALHGAPDLTHILMIDDDVLIPKDTIPVLLALDCGIASGCYPGIKKAYKAGPILAPYVMVRQDRQWRFKWFDGIVECDAVGGGCMLIRRDVLWDIGFPWFRWPQWIEEGRLFHKSDDVDFCDRAREKGHVIKAHGNVRCSHLKTVDVAQFIAPPEGTPWNPTWRGPRMVAEQEAWPGYGTHVPVLRALGQFLGDKAQRIVEYGSGVFSTMTFIDPRAFPHATSIVSYEANPQWIDRLQQHIGVDDRWSIYMTPLDRMIDNLHEDVDVVLIDCDEKPPVDADGRRNADRFDARIALIQAYQHHPAAVVIVHDSNFSDLNPVVEQSAYRHRMTYKPRFGPQTTVLSNRFAVECLDVNETKFRDLMTETPEPALAAT